MWWTQPRLVVTTCSIYAVAYAAVVFSIPGALGRYAAIGTAGVIVVFAYRHVSLELARRHESGLMRQAFDETIWERRWRRSDRFDFCDLATALDAEPGPRGDADRGERFHEPLAEAMSKIEAARFRAPENWITFAVGLALGLVALSVPWFDNLQRAMWGGALAPMVASSFLGSLVDHAAGNSLLRAGAVQRVAFLAPRTFADLGLGSWGYRLQVPVATTIAALMSVGALVLWSESPPKSIAFGLVAAYILVILAAEHFVLRHLPLLRFRGPPEVSAFIDHQLRTARILFMTAPAGLFVVVTGSLATNFDGMTGLAAGAVIAASYIFAWKPERIAQNKSPKELAAHLHGLQRRWGLSAETSGTGPEPPLGLSEASR